MKTTAFTLIENLIKEQQLQALRDSEEVCNRTTNQVEQLKTLIVAQSKNEALKDFLQSLEFLNRGGVLDKEL